VSELLPFLVLGIATGSLYGLAGLGLVLTYRTSGIFNFAHGALAAAAAYLFYTLHFQRHWPWPLAGFVAVALFGPLAGVVMERLARGLVGAKQETTIVATIGILLLVQGFLYWRYGYQRTFPEFLPERTAFTVSGGVTVTWDQVIKVGVGVASLVALVAFLRRTRLGVAMRAVVASPDLLGLTGTSPARVRVAAWMIGCSFASLSGVLIAPIVSLDAFLLSALVVQAFGAVAVGRFTSLPMTYLGGLGVGVLAALAQKQFGAHPPLNGLPTVVPFLVLIAVLLVTPARRLPRGAGGAQGTLTVGRRLPRQVTAAGAVAVGGLLLAVPHLVGPRLPVYSTGLALAILFLSLSLLTRVSGQISLAHAAFAGVGAATFSHLSATGGAPWLVGLLGAGLVTAAIGALLALPAMRLSGIYLALATLGFGLLMDNVVFQTGLFFGQNTEGLRGAAPEFGPIHASSSSAVYYVVLAAAAVCAALMVGLRRARLGRFLRAMADSPTALTTMGLGLNVTRLLVFSVSAFFAGIAGALYLVQVGDVTPISFNFTTSLMYLAVLTVAGAVAGFVSSALLAAGLLVVLPSYLTSITLEKQSILFGAVAVAAALVADGRVDWAALAARGRGRPAAAAAGSAVRHRRSPSAARAGQP